MLRVGLSVVLEQMIFESFERYDPQVPRYNGYLNDKGYAGDNPWHDWANAAQGEGNSLASGWAMRHASKPARVRMDWTVAVSVSTGDARSG